MYDVDSIYSPNIVYVMTISRNYINLFIISLICLLCLGVLFVLSKFTNISALSISVLLIFSCFCFFILKLLPQSFMLMSFYLFFRITVLFSGVFIEYGAYMIEIASEGVATGAFIRYAMYLIIECLVVLFVLEVNKRPIQSYTKRVSNIDYTIIFWAFPVLLALYLYVFIIGLINGFPLFTGIDRFVYRIEVADFFFNQFIFARLIIGLFLGLMYSTQNKSLQTKSLLFFILTLIISILFGEKFTSLIALIIFFFLPKFILSSVNYKNLMGKFLILGVLLCVITLPVVLIVYGWNEDSYAALERLNSRVAGQGQTWFITDYYTHELFRFDTNEVIANIKATFSLNPDNIAKQYPYIGIRDLMADNIPTVRLSWYQLFDITLNFGFEAYLLKMFGYLGMIPFVIFYSIVFGLSLRYVYYAIATFSPIHLLFSGRILIWTTFGFQQGDLYYLLGVQVFVFVLIACIYRLFTETTLQRTS